MIKALFSCCIALTCAATYGSGGDYATAVFVHEYNPGDVYAFNRGGLGILRPTYQERHLVVAYRWLSGLDVNESEARLLQPSPQEMDARTQPDQEIEAWMKARRDALAAAVTIVPDRAQADFRFSPNCAADAFRNATATLRVRLEQHGKDNPAVLQWLAGQDLVFGNCSRAGQLPATVPAAAPQWLRHDRAYQLAAARFYRGDYPQAAAAFDAIAADPESPWRRLAVYLVARARVWQLEAADTGAESNALRPKAASAIARVLQDPALAEWQVDALKLKTRIAVAAAETATLEKAVLAPRLSPNAWQEVHDFLLLSDRGNSPLGTWLKNLSSNHHDEALSQALAAWQTTRSRPWLIAGLRHAAELRKPQPQLEQAAAELVPADPAYLSANYWRLRALRLAGQTEAAHALADALLALPGLDLSARNLLLAERMTMAPDLDAFLRDALRRPVEIGYPLSENGYEGTPERFRLDPALNWREEVKQGPGIYFDQDGANVINAAMPYATLRQAADAPLPSHLSRVLLTAAFTRSFLLGELDLGLVPRLSEHYPQVDELKQLKASPDPVERRFLAALALLKLPGASPQVDAGLGRLAPPDKIGLTGSRWWEIAQLCRLIPGKNWDWDLSACLPEKTPSIRPMFPPFVQGQALERSQQEAAQIVNAGAPAGVFGRVILDWEKSHQADPRLPEALHLVVRASRYGSNDCASGAASKEAFRVLHKRFGQTPWAGKTPNWYGGGVRCSSAASTS